MKVKDLVQEWEKRADSRLIAREYHVKLPLQDAARIAALVEMYPTVTETTIISDLLSAALDELEAALPYVPGNKVIAKDDHGDPIYEDVGNTAHFLELIEKHAVALERELPVRC